MDHSDGGSSLGFEWFALGVSSLNFMVYELSHLYVNYLGLIFLDTFSRAFGIPITTVAGLMVVTHRYRPSVLADVLLFLIPGIATLFLLTQAAAPFLPYILLSAWTVFTIFCLYFAYQLLKYGETVHACLMAVVAIGNQGTAMAYDLFKFPGSDTNIVFNFYTIALFLWAYLTVQTYYSYLALERAKDRAERGLAAASPIAVR
jgi:hypothetical protein